MTNEPHRNDKSDLGSDEPSQIQRKRHKPRYIGLSITLALLAGTAGGIWYSWFFVHNRLAPLVETNLSQTLKRPVNLGQLEWFTLNGLRFGPSSIPATSTDSDRLSVQAVDVTFDPLQLLLTRKLKLNVALIKPQIYLEQAKTGAWVSTQIRERESTGPIQTELESIRFQDGVAVLLPAAKSKTESRLPLTYTQMTGRAQFFDQNRRIAYQLTGQSKTRGNLRLSGESLRTVAQAAPTIEANLQIQVKNIPVSELDRLLRLPFSLQTGRVSGNFSIQVRPNQTLPYVVGLAQFQNVTLKIANLPRTFTQSNGLLRLRGDVYQLEQTTTRFGEIPLEVKGQIATKQGFDLASTVRSTDLATVLRTLRVKLPFATAGEVGADLRVTGSLRQPVLSGFAYSTRAGRIDRVNLQQYQARFQLASANQVLSVTSLQATPVVGGQITGAGQIVLGQQTQLALNFNAVNVPGDAIARLYNNGNPPSITVGRVNARTRITGLATQPQTFVRWQAPEATYPGTGEVLIANGVTTLRNTVLNVAGGTVKAAGRAVAGRWQASVIGYGIPLNRFSPGQRGTFSSQLRLAGTLASFRPTNIRARGQVRFSQGIAVIGEPIVAQVCWDGQKILVDRAISPGLLANGTIAARLEGKPEITGLALNVRTDRYDLNRLALRLPPNLNYTGQADFSGRVTGTPTDPRVAGGLTLYQFRLNNIAFEPILRGSLQVNQGVNLNVSGRQDQIALTLGADYSPIAFEIQRGTAIARGRTQGDLLLVEAQNFPLSVLNAAAGGQIALLPLSGDLSGNLAVNLKQRTANGQVVVSRPGYGGFRAEQFSGRIGFTNGIATLSEAELRRGSSIFQVSGTATLQGLPQFKGQLKVAQGQLQDVLELLQVFDIADLARGFQAPTYGTAADLQTVPASLNNAPLITQLRRLSEIEALLAQVKARRASAPLPELRELQGSFSGEVNVAGSLQRGINADFNLQGQNWQWGPYSAKQVVAIGTFENNALTLLPLRFQSDQSLVTFSGQIGGRQQSGQFRMENVPIESLVGLVPLPFDIEGQLNATATLSGNFENPQAVGSLTLDSGVLNGTPVQQSRASFQYANAQLNFGSEILLATPEPIQIAGSVPLQLPFATVKPASNAIDLKINVKNEGLALLNVFSQQIAWEDGQGQVNLQVQGTLDRPVATGTIQVQNATLRARALPEPLTDVTGTIQFVSDRARVENLQGKFSQGTLIARGVIPIFANLSPTDPDQANPLNVAMERIRIRLKGLYQGGVAGDLQIAGNLLNPVVGGEIRLSDGQVLLADAEATPAGTGNQAGDDTGLEFDNLKLALGDRVRITREPILNFLASGDLTLNGGLRDIRPSGTIRLRAGQVNLFTTQFTLVRGYAQTAEFVPNQGLDPNLDIRLVASVPEISRTRQPSATLPSEILDTPTPASAIGSVQTVRIRAQARGPASRLFDNLELTSSPARSPSEIIALIGGGFVETLGRGDSVLGIANLAGSALLTNIQSVIGNALGLSEFRLFPTLTREDRARESRGGATLGLAAEAAIDITPALSVSILRILTSNQPTQFGLRYRLGDEFLLRGSTDLSGDNRAVLEYEARF